MIARYAGIFAVCFVTACAQTPQQVVFQAKETYVGAGTVFIAYGSQPRCGSPGAKEPPLCSSQAIVDAGKKADNVAVTALDSAETAVRTPGFTESMVTAAAASARAAVDAFVAITTNLKGK